MMSGLEKLKFMSHLGTTSLFAVVKELVRSVLENMGFLQLLIYTRDDNLAKVAPKLESCLLSPLGSILQLPNKYFAPIEV